MYVRQFVTSEQVQGHYQSQLCFLPEQVYLPEDA